MSKESVRTLIRGMTNALKKHSPEILTGIGIAGMILTTITAVKVTPKALRAIEEKKQAEQKEELKPTEVVKAAWKYYIPSAVTGTLAIACVIGASSVSHRRNAALATAYTLSETALKEFQDKTGEVVGEKKEQEIRNAVAQGQVSRVPLDEKKIINTGRGEELFFDPLSGRYFRSSSAFIEKCENALNKRMRDEIRISLNEFYDELGLPEVDRSVGDVLGWDIDKGYIDLTFDWILDPPDETGIRLCVVGHNNPPNYKW